MSQIGGWFKCYRQLEDSAIWGNPELVYFWVWCLMQADIEKHKTQINGHTVTIKPGQFIFGRKKAAQKTGLPESTVYRYLNLLQSLKMVNIKPNNKYTLVTIVNWRKYQGDAEKVNNKRTTNDTAKEHTIRNIEAENPPQKSAELCEEEKDDFVNEDGTYNWDAVEDEE